jgi:CRISPR type III-A-associated RAMP protein Csm4
MNPGLVVKLRPVGPWRSGTDTGARNEVDVLYHSDTLYSAVASAMAMMGHLDAWLEATARNLQGPAVAFSSMFPFLEDIGFIVPPRTIWPPDTASAKVRWKGARFIPLSLVGPLFASRALEEDGWKIDGPSQCLIPQDRGGVIRISVRSSAAVDRLSGAVDPHEIACIEFLPGAGLWTVVSFANEEARGQWSDLIRAAFRLLADSGFGGRRAHGWGRAETPEFIEGTLPDMILSFEGAPPMDSWWLLSLFNPAAEDTVDWNAGNYCPTTRGGRIESAVRAGMLKKQLPMLVEGSVIVSAAAPRGGAPDVSPEGFPHPVYRSGFAVAIPIPAQVVA